MDTTQNQLRLDRRIATSNLRILLRHNVTNAVEQFCKVNRRDTTYIWNANTNNIIATIRQFPGKKLFVRYRANSHYAPTIVSWAESINALCVASAYVGIRHRRIRRNLRSSVSRAEVLNRLAREKPIAHLYDALTKQHVRVEGMALQRPHASITQSTSQFTTTTNRGQVLTERDLLRHMNNLDATISPEAYQRLQQQQRVYVTAQRGDAPTSTQWQPGSIYGGMDVTFDESDDTTNTDE